MQERRGIEKPSGLFVRDAPKPLVVRSMLFGAIFGNKIGHTCARDRGFEARSLRDGPFAHVAAVGPATDAETIEIADTFVGKVVDTGHDVFEVAASPVGTIAFDEFFTVANRTANVGIEHRVT